MSRTSALFLAVLVGVVLCARLFFVFGAGEPELVQEAGSMAVVVGVVVDDPDRRSTAVRAVVEVESVNAKPAEGRVLAVLPRGAALEYGDWVEVRGLLEEPEPFETDTGRAFDYKGYLAARGVSLLMPFAQLQERVEGGWSLLRTLYALKHTFEHALERVMQEPQAALMEGLLLGEKAGLPSALTQAFVVAGLIHIVVLSGYNIGVVAEWVLRFLALFMRRRAALVVAAVAIVLFALMAGGGMATVRATAMGLIALLARYLDRPAAALRALAAAVVLMVLWNPLVLIDAGFILSVLATFGLITLAPSVETYLRWLPGAGLRSTAATTIAVQLYVLPALLYFTGVLSFISVPLNVLVLPLVPFAMLTGFLAGLLALIHPYLALLPALLADSTLSLLIWLAEVGAALPLASTVVSAFPVWVAFLVYLPLTAWAIWKYQRTAAPSPTSSDF